MCVDCFTQNPKKRARVLRSRSLLPKKTGGRGVYVDRSRSSRVKFIYYSNSRSKGVGTDHVRYYYQQNKMLYHVPCVCGSFVHRRTNHKHCPLNPRYDDGIE